MRRQVFRFSERESDEDLSGYLDRVLLRAPLSADDLPSLICEDRDGRITGFLGVVPRSMTFRGAPLRVAVATQLMVRPGARGVIGQRLARAFMNGPQDLALSDTANDAARLVWERVGGTNVRTHGLTWTRVVRPWRYAAAARGRAIRALARVARPALSALDRAAGGSWREPVPRGEIGLLDGQVMLAHFDEVAGARSLRPEYRADVLEWLLARVREKRVFGDLHEVAVWSSPGVIAGWVLYFLRPGGVAQVAQIAARPGGGSTGLVLDHLFHDAWRHGAIAVSGRLEPAMMPDLVARKCEFRREGPWMLVHARDPEVMRAIERGDAFLSRLEGEWWMSF